MNIKLRNGTFCALYPVPLYRRRYRRGIYSRPTDWIVQAGRGPIAWGRTRKEAITQLKRQLKLI